MPSPLFNDLAHSQFELLSHSLVHLTNDETTTTTIKPGTPKISSMAFYLPKENQNTGQLEFVPAATFPNRSSERVFIASSDSSNSGGIHQPPTIPASMGGVLELPGFFKARDLIPTYPFVSSSSEATEDDNNFGEHELFSQVSPDSPISVSVVEEISMPANNAISGPSSLSVTLFSGLDTLGVFMILPYKASDASQNQWKWTSGDKLQVTRAAKSLALALSMDNERASTQLANEQFHVAMSDSLHQVKSPLQALRTFGKLLQRQLAEETTDGRGAVAERVPSANRRQKQALKLAEDMMTQGEHVIELIEPMDAIVQNGRRYLLSGDTKKTASSALTLQPSNALHNEDTAEIPQHHQLPPSMPTFGDFELEMTFPQDILGSIVYASQAISREKGINFDAIGFEPDNLELPGVTVCPKHLKEAVSNLLDNAIKYAPVRKKGKKGRPRIPHIKVSLKSNEYPLSPGATLYIEDNGPGILRTEQDKVFERGYRSEEVEDAVGGSGLGLAIAREMISRMGGMIDVLDEGPHKLDGTTMRVILFRDPES